MAPTDDNVPLFRVCPNRCKRLGDGRIGYTLVTLDKQSSDELRRRRSRPQVWPEGVCEKLVEGETEHWEFVEIIADESWESFELFCEARDGLLILTKSEGATEETLELLEIDRQLNLLQAEVHLLEGLSRAESALDLKTEIQEAQDRRPKAVCKVVLLTSESLTAHCKVTLGVMMVVGIWTRRRLCADRGPWCKM